MGKAQAQATAEGGCATQSHGPSGATRSVEEVRSHAERGNVFSVVCGRGDRSGSFRAEAAVGRPKPRNLARKAMRSIDGCPAPGQIPRLRFATLGMTGGGDGRLAEHVRAWDRGTPARDSRANGPTRPVGGPLVAVCTWPDTPAAGFTAGGRIALCPGGWLGGCGSRPGGAGRTWPRGAGRCRRAGSRACRRGGAWRAGPCPPG